MKTQKLLVIVTISCVLLGVSGGAVMATGCGDGLIQNETFDGNLVIIGDSCTIISSTIAGDILVRNSNYVLILNNKVGGDVEISDGGVANVIANTVFNGDLIVRDNDVANVIENESLADDIHVISNTTALVQKNIAFDDIICSENTVLSAFVNFAGDRMTCD